MGPERVRPWWPAAVLAAVGLTFLYAGALGTRFLNDDYLFLEEARARPLAQSLAQLGALGNYYRPLSRQIYFETLASFADGHALIFHAVNYALFLAALALLADLLRVLVPPAGALAGCLYFAVLPLHSVNLTWVSCSQDLLALTGVLGALALYRRGRVVPSVLCYVAAIASKESALPLPLAIAAWDRWIERRPWPASVRRLAPFAVVGLAWAALAITMRSRNPAAAPLHFGAGYFLAGYAHLIQSLVGIEHPRGLGRALIENGPPLVPLALIALLAWWHSPAHAGSSAGSATRPGAVAALSSIWLIAFGFVTGPVSYSWSGYYYTLAAVGGAMLVAHLLRNGDRWTWLALSASLLSWHAAGVRVRAFATEDRPWGWTSHLTPFYFQRAAALTDSMSRQLTALEPKPEPGTRFFFATLPPWAGFQMGNGALIRTLYRDTSLASYFYSQFSESTAADRPCRIFYWDGRGFEALYRGDSDPFFQVGGDLLLLDRPAGAAHAFRRGLMAGENRLDHLYWLGWAELWRGRRDAAEAAWIAFGARDDSLRWVEHMRAARTALIERPDSLRARRELLQAISFAIGRPEAHGALGRVLRSRSPKYALLELKVASWLDPGDLASRRELTLGLVAARLDDPARRELEALLKFYPAAASDSALAVARRLIERRSDQGRGWAEF